MRTAGRSKAKHDPRMRLNSIDPSKWKDAGKNGSFANEGKSLMLNAMEACGRIGGLFIVLTYARACARTHAHAHMRVTPKKPFQSFHPSKSKKIALTNKGKIGSVALGDPSITLPASLPSARPFDVRRYQRAGNLARARGDKPDNPSKRASERLSCDGGAAR